MINCSQMIPQRYRRAMHLKKSYAAYYKFTFAIMGGAWVYDASDMCRGWYPFPVIRILGLRDRTPKW